MLDRDTVIETLQYLISGECTDTQFDYLDEIKAAITLLKEQEAIESIDFGDRTDIMANLEGLTWDDWRMYHSDTEVQNIAQSVFNLLIDTPEIVRCKDCKHAVLTTSGEAKYCKFWQGDEDGTYGGDPLYLDGDFYCAAGERR